MPKKTIHPERRLYIYHNYILTENHSNFNGQFFPLYMYFQLQSFYFLSFIIFRMASNNFSPLGLPNPVQASHPEPAE